MLLLFAPHLAQFVTAMRLFNAKIDAVAKNNINILSIMCVSTHSITLGLLAHANIIFGIFPALLNCKPITKLIQKQLSAWIK
jgi:hypothetical protein